MAHAFFLGVDLHGETTDEATFALLEKEKNPDDEAAQFRLDHIRHLSDVESIEGLADHLQGLVSDQPYIGRTSLIVNRGREAGQALVQALRDRGLDPVAATLTSGRGGAGGDSDDVGVQLGTIEVVRGLVDLYREGRFVMEEHSREVASRMARDLQHAFEVLDEAEGDEASGEAPGSLQEVQEAAPPLTSVSLAAWLGQERSFDPSQHLKSAPQTNPSRSTTGS